jgi:hypothetical protein
VKTETKNPVRWARPNQLKSQAVKTETKNPVRWARPNQELDRDRTQWETKQPAEPRRRSSRAGHNFSGNPIWHAGWANWGATGNQIRQQGRRARKIRSWLTFGFKNRSAHKRQPAAQPSREPAPSPGKNQKLAVKDPPPKQMQTGSNQAARRPRSSSAVLYGLKDQEKHNKALALTALPKKNLTRTSKSFSAGLKSRWVLVINWWGYHSHGYNQHFSSWYLRSNYLRTCSTIKFIGDLVPT